MKTAAEESCEPGTSTTHFHLLSGLMDPNAPQKPRKVTLDMVLEATSLTKSSKETSDAYLARVTHLHLQGKRIKVIEGLELCTNLKVQSLRSHR